MKIDEQTIQNMLAQATRARNNAYVPYSKFPVGACVLSEDNQMFTGCNVENASYRLTICAEASAIAAMASAGKRHIHAILIVGPEKKTITPCGACRQMIREFASPSAPIYLCDEEQIREITNIEELLPRSFGPEYLSEN
ncbi:MAG: cytidine deaminase [Gammaproteobacteria bacterium]|jgi:cytidine deaminase